MNQAGVVFLAYKEIEVYLELEEIRVSKGLTV